VRRHVRDRALSVFAQCDVIIAPCMPMSAPEIGTEWITLEGERMLARPNLGLFTQPISFLGWPVAAVPVARPSGMLPIGVQVIAAPWREDHALRVAAALEQLGVAAPRCIFLDDLGINLKPAAAMGMATIKVLTSEQARAELSALLDLEL
jgi:Asp-tRNA(Asn)/Glu-tRNA(Gln) amidotransferase A subunit family amidase